MFDQSVLHANGLCALACVMDGYCSVGCIALMLPVVCVCPRSVVYVPIVAWSSRGLRFVVVHDLPSFDTSLQLDGLVCILSPSSVSRLLGVRAYVSAVVAMAVDGAVDKLASPGPSVVAVFTGLALSWAPLTSSACPLQPAATMA
jgi:hypothetical protein